MTSMEEKALPGGTFVFIPLDSRLKPTSIRLKLDRTEKRVIIRLRSTDGKGVPNIAAIQYIVRKLLPSYGVIAFLDEEENDAGRRNPPWSVTIMNGDEYHIPSFLRSHKRNDIEPGELISARAYLIEKRKRQSALNVMLRRRTGPLRRLISSVRSMLRPAKVKNTDGVRCIFIPHSMDAWTTNDSQACKSSGPDTCKVPSDTTNASPSIGSGKTLR